MNLLDSPNKIIILSLKAMKYQAYLPHKESAFQWEKALRVAHKKGIESKEQFELKTYWNL